MRIWALTLLLTASPAEPRTLAGFRELLKARKGEAVRLHVALVGATDLGPGKEGLLFPEPCSPADPSIGPDGRSAVVLNVGGVPHAVAERLARARSAEAARGQGWTCYDLVVRLTELDGHGAEGGKVDARYVSTEPRGQRPPDKRLQGE